MFIPNRNYSITGHMVVKNEDRWIWFAIMSVIDFLDQLIIYDTGSIDNTNRIIKEIINVDRYRNKIIYEKLGEITSENFHKVRQRQIDISKTDYFMVVDGDEIWYQNSLAELDKILSLKQPLLVATKFINCCGDIFHYRNDNRETYCICGITGSITIRVYSMNIPGIKCSGYYGVEGYIDESGTAVQEGKYSIEIMNERFLHTSLLNRSSVQNGDYSIKYRRSKLNTNWDSKFESNFVYPEVFSYEYPQMVKSPYDKDINIIRLIYSLKNLIKRKLRL